MSSLVAAICYAWMLSSKADGQAAVPVVNMHRGRMVRCRQAAWLLYHVGVDASALLFADEVRDVISREYTMLRLCYETRVLDVDGFVSDKSDNCLGPGVIGRLFWAEATRMGYIQHHIAVVSCGCPEF